MKSKIWPDDTTMVEMDGWLAELREDGAANAPGARTAEAPGARTAEPPSAGWAEAASAGRAGVPSAGWAEPPSAGRAEGPSVRRAEGPSAGWAEAFGGGARRAVHAEPAALPPPAAPAQPAAVAEPAALAEAGVRPLIGDGLRMPIMWCEMGSCISWHSDPAALGESDSRARAISAGWRIDAFGRLACPQCQQTDPTFRSSRPVVLWDRATAIARAARVAAMYGQPMAS